MIGVEVRDGEYVITLPKMTLVLRRFEFLAALRRGKSLRRREALTRCLASAAEVAAERRARGLRDDDGEEGDAACQRH